MFFWKTASIEDRLEKNLTEHRFRKDRAFIKSARLFQKERLLARSPLNLMEEHIILFLEINGDSNILKG